MSFDSSDPTVEYLAAGRPDRPRRRWRLAALAAVVALATLVGAALVADWGARNVEMNSLVTAVEASEQAMKTVQDQVSAVIKPYEDGEPLTDAQRQKVLDELAVIARRGYDAVSAAGQGVADVRLLPWQRRLVAAREDYLAHNRAWQNYLQAASTDATQFFQPQQEVNDTFFASEGPMRAAVPRPALFDLRARVDAIYAESDNADDPGNPGQSVRWS